MTFETAVTTGFGLTIGVALGGILVIMCYALSRVIGLVMFGKVDVLLKEAGVHETIVASVAAQHETKETT